MISVKEELLDSQLHEMTIDELRKLLSSKHLPTFGARNELIGRIETFVYNEWNKPPKIVHPNGSRSPSPVYVHAVGSQKRAAVKRAKDDRKAAADLKRSCLTLTRAEVNARLGYSNGRFITTADESDVATPSKKTLFPKGKSEVRLKTRSERNHVTKSYAKDEVENEADTGEMLAVTAQADWEDLLNQSNQSDSSLSGFIGSTPVEELPIFKSRQDKLLEKAEKALRRERREAIEEKIREKLRAQMEAEYERKLADVKADIAAAYEQQLEAYRRRLRLKKTVEISSDDEDDDVDNKTVVISSGDEEDDVDNKTVEISSDEEHNGADNKTEKSSSDEEDDDEDKPLVIDEDSDDDELDPTLLDA